MTKKLYKIKFKEDWLEIKKDQIVIIPKKDLDSSLRSGYCEYTGEYSTDGGLTWKKEIPKNVDVKIESELPKSIEFKDNKSVRSLKDITDPLVKKPKKTQVSKEETIKNLQADYEKTSYIFNKDELLKSVIFPQCKIGDSFAFGMMLPKMVNLQDKEGNIVGKDQKWFPVLITSDRKLLTITKELQLREKIKLSELPTHMNLRWSLEDIKKFLDGESKSPPPIDIFNDIRNQYSKFLFFINDEWYDIHALWDIGTYNVQNFNTYPLIEMRGLAGTAKTKTMEVSQRITLNSSEIMTNPSEATLFRETHVMRPTKYIDEAEKLFAFNKNTNRMDSDSRAELINSSYKKGGSVPRQEKIGGKFVTVNYFVYSPTMLGSINGLYGATESRAITHIMTKAPDKDKRGEFEPLEAPESDFEEIRNKLYLFTLFYWKKIESAYLNLKPIDDIKKRDFQLWRPILALAQVISPDVFERVKVFAVKMSQQRKNDIIIEGSFEFDVLEALKKNLGGINDLIYVTKIVESYFEGKDLDSKTKKGLNRRVSTKLDSLGFKFCRDRDKFGSFFKIPFDLFETVVSPISPEMTKDLHTSTSSTSSLVKYIKKDVDSMTNDVEAKTELMTKMKEDDEDVGTSDKESEKIKKKIDPILVKKVIGIIKSLGENHIPISEIYKKAEEKLIPKDVVYSVIDELLSGKSWQELPVGVLQRV